MSKGWWESLLNSRLKAQTTRQDTSGLKGFTARRGYAAGWSSAALRVIRCAATTWIYWPASQSAAADVVSCRDAKPANLMYEYPAWRKAQAGEDWTLVDPLELREVLIDLGTVATGGGSLHGACGGEGRGIVVSTGCAGVESVAPEQSPYGLQTEGPRSVLWCACV